MEECRFQIIKCVNPFKKQNHLVRDKNKLRNVTERMHYLVPDLPETSKVCDVCRKEITVLKVQKEKEERYPDSNNDPNFNVPTTSSHVVETLNTSLKELGESPIDVKKIKSKQYSGKKIKKIESAMRRTLFPHSQESSGDEPEKLESSVLSNLKANFSSAHRKKKVMILTCLPETWSVRKIMREFNAPNYMVRQAKRLLKEKGILASPDQKPGKSLSQEIVHTVRLFYESDEVSRIMPGKRDCISVKDENGSKTAVQKRLILCNLQEAYVLFKEKYPQMKVGFSKFAELRSKQCILVGKSGTHSVCVCTIHQNVKLMIENARLGTLTNGNFSTYKHFLSQILCNPPSIDCNMGNCNSCPGTNQITDTLENVFEENMIENISFRQWIAVDRCSLEIIQKSSTEFLEMLCDKLGQLVCHDFIAKQQSLFMNEVKETLKENECAVTLDFSENYAFVVQDEAQSYHWSSDYVTIHPFVIYYKQDDKVKHVSYVIISECLEHNTTAVYCFQKKLIQFLKSYFQFDVEKIYYFSDGSAAQYKNKKNFSNLCFHTQDFGIEAEWHFSATAHGKGPCDGVGGTVKRLATRASLQRPYENQILTPQQLFDWSIQNIKTVNFELVKQEEYIETENFLCNRFEKAQTIKGTQQFHAFLPIKDNLTQIKVKFFSYDTNYSTVSTTKTLGKISMADINGYVTVTYNSKWWLAYVLDKNVSEEEVKVTFLHPAGPSPSFSYPSVKPDILWTSLNDILCTVDPTTPTGRIYRLSEEDTAKSNETLKQLDK